jgi:acetolactate synthase-1/2/3 large subunit
MMAAAVERQGVRTVFGLPGHLESFFGALDRRGMRLVHLRHESPCVIAADAYAQTRRTLGVACVTSGPGLANAVGGIASAFDAGAPVLIFAGRNPLRMLDYRPQQELDHVRLVRSITKWARVVHEPSRVAEYVDTAARIALSGDPGPVLLEIPRDVALAEVDEAFAARSLGPLVRAARPLPAAADVERALALVRAAERPLIVAGKGAHQDDAAAALGRLRDMGIPVLLAGPARGLIPEDDQRAFGWPIGSLAAAAADVVVFAGARLEGSIGFASPPFVRDDAKLVQIYADPGEIGRNRPIDAPIAADVAASLDALADGLEAAGRTFDPGWARERIAPRLAAIDAAGRSETGAVHPLRMARELAARMPADAIFVGDGANCNNWFKAVIRAARPAGFIDHEPFGAMGVGLPQAIGATAAVQEDGTHRPVFLGTGDGAVGQYLGELASAAQHRLPVVAMVANDGFWGSSRTIALRQFGGTTGTDLPQSRYDVVAQGLGCDGQFAETPAEVGPALDRAIAASRTGIPSLVNVMVDAVASAERGDPLLQMISFNRQRFGGA